MNREALVSIIVPIYNTSAFLPRVLKCLAVQTYSNIEIILVNDGSVDDSERICLDWTGKDSRFRYFFQPNGGVSKARNTGLDVAVGQYITFVDSDDWVEPIYVQSLLDLMIENTADISAVSFFERKSVENPGAKMLFAKEAALIQMISGKYYEGTVCGKMFKAELFSTIRFPEGIALGEDMIVVAKTICNAVCLAFQELPLYHYFWNANSATKAKWNPKVWSCQETARMLNEIIQQYFPDKKQYGEKVACYWNLVIAQKLSDCGRLNQENYQLVKREILKYHSAEAEMVMRLRLKMELRIFIWSRNMYIFFRWLFKNPLIMKLRKIT